MSACGRRRQFRYSAPFRAAGDILANARAFAFRAEGMESVRLSEIYCKLEEIEADKAPARCVCVCVRQ